MRSLSFLGKSIICCGTLRKNIILSVFGTLSKIKRSAEMKKVDMGLVINRLMYLCFRKRKNGKNAVCEIRGLESKMNFEI